MDAGNQCSAGQEDPGRETGPSEAPVLGHGGSFIVSLSTVRQSMLSCFDTRTHCVRFNKQAIAVMRTYIDAILKGTIVDCRELAPGSNVWTRETLRQVHQRRHDDGGRCYSPELATSFKVLIGRLVAVEEMASRDAVFPIDAYSLRRVRKFSGCDFASDFEEELQEMYRFLVFNLVWASYIETRTARRVTINASDVRDGCERLLGGEAT